jgi:PAS domain S-box-containing protein
MSSRHKSSLNSKWCETTLRSVGDAVIATDAQGSVLFMNAVAETLTGWTSADAECRPLAEVLVLENEATHAILEGPTESCLRSGQRVELPEGTRLIRRDGTALDIDDSTAPIRDSHGSLLGLVVVFRDVTAQCRERRRRSFFARATAELSASLDYDLTLATVARLPVPEVADCCAVDVVTGDSLRRLAVAHVDEAKARLLESVEASPLPGLRDGRGLKEVLLTGRPDVVPELTADMIDPATIDPAQRKLLEELRPTSYIRVPLMHGADAVGVITLFDAESGRHFEETDLCAARAFATIAAVAIERAQLVKDLERARLDAEARRAEAEAANRTKDEFLAMLGHELRNPLAPVLTALELIRLRGCGRMAHECAVIDRQLKHLRRLVDDLLDASRIARGKIEVHREVIEVAEVVTASVEMVKPLLEEREQEVQVSVAPKLFVSGDRERLAQVAANLLSNAAKYSDRGSRISISAQRDVAEIVLNVQDPGIGIEPGRLSQIFELFAQAPQALDRAQGGLGIGLAIARAIVELHGGSISASSSGPGTGSTFRVRLRAVDGPSGPGAAEVEAPPEPASSVATRVLIVDDNADALDLLASALPLLGYEAVTAADGPAALALASETHPSIALLDIGLPVMDGYELARRLRAIDDSKALKLVAITGYGSPTDRVRAFEAGFDEHLVKPVSLEVLEDVIERLVPRTARWGSPAGVQPVHSS